MNHYFKIEQFREKLTCCFYNDTSKVTFGFPLFSLEGYQKYLHDTIPSSQSCCIPLSQDDDILTITEIVLNNVVNLPVFLLCPFAESLIKYETFFLSRDTETMAFSKKQAGKLQSFVDAKKLFVFNDLSESFAINYFEPAIFLVSEDIKHFFSFSLLQSKNEFQACLSGNPSSSTQETLTTFNTFVDSKVCINWISFFYFSIRWQKMFYSKKRVIMR